MDRRRFLTLVTAALTTLALRLPAWARDRLLLVPREMEEQLGVTGFNQMIQEARAKGTYLDRGSQRGRSFYERTDAVVRRITQASGLGRTRWEYAIIDQPDVVNAGAFPGGRIVVYTGMFPVTETEAGLGTVLGHEVAHVVARHGGERMSQGVLVEGIGGIANLLLQGRGANPEAVKIFTVAYGLGSRVGYLLPFERRHELEADRLGLFLMAKAGYAPREALTFWQRMERAASGKEPEFLSTHPSAGRRVHEIERLLPEAEGYSRNPSKPLPKI
jgi:predicted Zn-dependent protease